MRTDVSFAVGSEGRRCLEVIVAGRNTKQKHVWRVRIILASAYTASSSPLRRTLQQNGRIAG